MHSKQILILPLIVSCAFGQDVSQNVVNSVFNKITVNGAICDNLMDAICNEETSLSSNLLKELDAKIPAKIDTANFNSVFRVGLEQSVNDIPNILGIMYTINCNNNNFKSMLVKIKKEIDNTSNSDKDLASINGNDCTAAKTIVENWFKDLIENKKLLTDFVKSNNIENILHSIQRSNQFQDKLSQAKSNLNQQLNNYKNLIVEEIKKKSNSENAKAAQKVLESVKIETFPAPDANEQLKKVTDTYNQCSLSLGTTEQFKILCYIYSAIKTFGSARVQLHSSRTPYVLNDDKIYLSDAHYYLPAIENCPKSIGYTGVALSSALGSFLLNKVPSLMNHETCVKKQSAAISETFSLHPEGNVNEVGTTMFGLQLAQKFLEKTANGKEAEQQFILGYGASQCQNPLTASEKYNDIFYGNLVSSLEQFKKSFDCQNNQKMTTAKTATCDFFAH